MNPPGHARGALTSRTLRIIVAVFPVLLIACKDDDDGPSCSFDTKTVLARLDGDEPAAWPKFRRDVANTGRIPVEIGTVPVERWVFPPREDGTSIGPVGGTPLIGKHGEIFVVGLSTDPEAADVKLYELDGQTGAITNKFTPTPRTPGSNETPAPTQTPGPPSIATAATITGTPLLGEDGTIVSAFENTGLVVRVGRLGFAEDLETNFTGALSGFISSSPNIDDDGAIYLGTSSSGLLYQVCPNMIPRFTIALGTTQSSAAVTRSGIVIIGANDARVVAIDDDARQYWAFFTAAPIRGAIVLQESASETEDLAGDFYVADDSGAVYAGELATGRCLWRVTGLEGAITASPALSRDGSKVFVATQAGRLYAIATRSEIVTDLCAPSNVRVLWQYPPADQPALGAIRSSPAVATGGESDVIVFGTDDGKVHAIEDAASGPRELAGWPFEIADEDGGVGTSGPSIGFDGAVMIGTEGGRIYAIDTRVAAPLRP